MLETPFSTMCNSSQGRQACRKMFFDNLSVKVKEINTESYSERSLNVIAILYKLLQTPKIMLPAASVQIYLITFVPIEIFR